MKPFEFTASAKTLAAIEEASAKNPLVAAFVNATDTEPAEIIIQGEIGNTFERADAKSVQQFLRTNKGKPVTVRINSEGGLVFDGIVMSNALAAHDGPVTTIVEGLAASAATLVAMAGKPAKMYENAQFMMHRSMGGAFGNRDVMEEVMSILDKIDESLAGMYQAKSNRPIGEMRKMMKGDGKKDGTWLSAKEAKSNGFIDEIVRLGKPATNLAESTLRQAKREESRREFLAKAQ